MYGSLQGADRYFAELLYGQFWDGQSEFDKQRALVTATRQIDTLRFAGRKNTETQPLQYPRNDEEGVPEAIQRATYEEAFALLKGVETDTEFANTFVTSQAFGKIRTDYDARKSPEHIVAGIASHRAWLLLKPYLDQCREIRLRRGS
jgi:hypothetical protein